MPTQTEGDGQAQKEQNQDQPIGAVCLLKPGERLQEGMICPRCQGAKMEYNGLLNLVCPNCGLTEAGACT
jgi:hypothetical protein